MRNALGVEDQKALAAGDQDSFCRKGIGKLLGVRGVFQAGIGGSRHVDAATAEASSNRRVNVFV